MHLEVNDSNYSNAQIINNDNYNNKNDFDLKEENENITSGLHFKKQDSVKSQYNEEMIIEIENYKENYFREMNQEIEKLKEFHLDEIQSFESKLNYFFNYS